MVNPYDPRTPAEPEEFGGRKVILQTVHEQIDSASALRRSGGILIQGFRGVGKSSLIRKLTSIVETEETAISGGAFVASCRLAKTTSDSELYKLITESLLEDISKKRSLADKIVGLKDLIKSLGVPGGLTVGFNQAEHDKSPHQRWRDLLNQMNGSGLIFVAVDDADSLSPEAIGELKTIVEEQKEVPVLLTVAGSTELEQRMIDQYSPVARIFSGASFNISSFDLEETREVLNRPIRQMPDVKWTEEGIRAVQHYTKGYPFLVKCLANASYRTGEPIDKKHVQSCLKSALDIARPWLDNKLREASDQDVISFYKIGRSNKLNFRSTDLNLLGVQAQYIGRLVKLKVLKAVSRGHYDLIEAPMIAYYHMLKRQLPMEEAEP
ncbi:MAG: ATP-binding protein [Candidatus Micrarchaeota archaeon]